MKTLSIIVPTYNVENYIEKCLGSFVIVGCMEDIEVLVIDDGSTDASSVIAHRFEKKYPGTFRVIAKENGGHGSTINRGIEEAAGRYFKVVDGDDWVEEKALIHLVSYLKQSGADMVVSNYLWVNEATGSSSPEVRELCPDVIAEHEYSLDEVDARLFLKMHAITFRTELLKKMPIRIREHSFYVDVEYILYPLPYVQKVAFIPDYVYQYRVGLPSQSMNITNMQKRCSQHEQILNDLLDYYSSLPVSSRKICMKKCIARMVCSQYKIYLSYRTSHKKELVSMEKRLKGMYPDIYRSVKNQSVVLLRRTGYALYPIASLILRDRMK